jgi:hypothetical protein
VQYISESKALPLDLLEPEVPVDNLGTKVNISSKDVFFTDLLDDESWTLIDEVEVSNVPVVTERKDSPSQKGSVDDPIEID